MSIYQSYCNLKINIQNIMLSPPAILIIYINFILSPK